MLRNFVRTTSLRAFARAPRIYKCFNSTLSTLSDTEANIQTGRPIPINVSSLEFAPLKHEPKYGDKVGEIILASFATKDLDLFSDFMMRAAFYLGIPAKGPAPLPRKTKRWTVIRSPFVHAKSKENFERITYRRCIQLFDTNMETTEVLLSVANKYAVPGVGVKANLWNNESIEAVQKLDVPLHSDIENPIAVNKVNLDALDGEVAQKVLEFLKDPAFGMVDNPEVQAKADEAEKSKN